MKYGPQRSTRNPKEEKNAGIQTPTEKSISFSSKISKLHNSVGYAFEKCKEVGKFMKKRSTNQRFIGHVKLFCAQIIVLLACILIFYVCRFISRIGFFERRVDRLKNEFISPKILKIKSLIPASVSSFTSKPLLEIPRIHPFTISTRSFKDNQSFSTRSKFSFHYLFF